MSAKTIDIWENWGKTQFATIDSILIPQDHGELGQIIQQAAETRKHIKALGAGHSFSGISQPQDIALKLEAFRGIIAVDQEKHQVTLGAGTHLYEIPLLLAPYGLAMQNLGDIDRQTLAGAVSTGTHGTGIAFGGIATQIRGLTLLDGQGNFHKITENSPEFPAAALSLGALGIITEITLQCVPTFVLEAQESTQPLEEILESFYELIKQADHYEFFWFPNTQKAITKTLQRRPGGWIRKPISPLRKKIEDQYISNNAFRLMCEFNHYLPRYSTKLAAIAAAAMGNRTYSDYSAQVLISAREVRFRESEWAVPLENLIPAFREISHRIANSGWPIIFPVEVRTAAADQLMLSTASARKTGYIAVHEYYRDTADGYFTECEKILLSYGGRPHWGKMHTQTAEYFQKIYPQFEKFLQIRNSFDPNRIFANPYLDAVLGE